MKQITENISPLPLGYEQWKRKAGWFFSGQAASIFGSAITQFAIIWHITLTTSSGVMIMISSLCSFLPQILISLFAGVWADRHNRKTIIIIADGMTAFSTLILAIIFMSGYRELWVLFLVSAIRSVGSGIQNPAVSAIIPQIVPQDKLMRMNGINGTIQSMTYIISPAVSGMVLSMFGMEAAFFIDVITAIIAIFILVRIKIPRLVRNYDEKPAGAFDDLKEGLRYTWKHPFLRTFLFFYAAMMFLITPSAFLSPLMVVRSFGDELWKITANEMVWSLGTVVGGVLISVWGGFKNRIHTIVLGTTIFGVFTMALGLSHTLTIFLVFLFISGISMPMINSPGMVMLQESVGHEMQGRVFSLVNIIACSAMPLGMAIFGPLGDMMQIEWLLIGSGIVLALLSFMLLLNPNVKHGVTSVE